MLAGPSSNNTKRRRQDDSASSNQSSASATIVSGGTMNQPAGTWHWLRSVIVDERCCQDVQSALMKAGVSCPSDLTGFDAQEALEIWPVLVTLANDTVERLLEVTQVHQSLEKSRQHHPKATRAARPALQTMETCQGQPLSISHTNIDVRPACRRSCNTRRSADLYSSSGYIATGALHRGFTRPSTVGRGLAFFGIRPRRNVAPTMAASRRGSTTKSASAEGTLGRDPAVWRPICLTANVRGRCPVG